jgi:hypothetical protein
MSDAHEAVRPTRRLAFAVDAKRLYCTLSLRESDVRVMGVPDRR